MLLIAILCDRIDLRFPRARRLWGVLLALMLVSQPIYYFAFHLPYYNEQVRPQTDAIDAMFRAALIHRRTQIYFVTPEIVDVPGTWMLQGFWSMEGEIFHQPTMSEEELRALPRDTDLIFFVPQADTETQEAIHRVFTNTQPLLSPYNIPADKQYVMFYVPAVSP
jgi:hypothetical protein